MDKYLAGGLRVDEFVTHSFGLAAIVVKLGGWYTVDGWTSLAVLVSFIGGVHLTVLGIIGEYISRIYDEVKARPLYLVAEHAGGAV